MATANCIHCGNPQEAEKMQQYFNTLPTNLQETIKQSGIELHNEQELKNCAEHFMHN